MGWSDNLATLDVLVAGYFDEDLITATPMRKPGRAVNADPEADPDRMPFEFLATIELDPEVVEGGPNIRHAPDSRAARNVARICLSALSTGWPWMPKQGDRLQRGSDTFVVAVGPDRDGTDRVVYWLNRIA